MMHYTYSVSLEAPNDFAAAAFIGSLHESADQWRRLKTPIHITSILPGGVVDLGSDIGDDLDPDGIDTIPLF